MMGKRRLVSNEPQAAVAMLLAGQSIAQIAEHFDTTDEQVDRALRAAWGGRHRKESLDQALAKQAKE